jgi:peptidoglycan/LPS O-acetylase OafA/YrhL
MITLGGGPREIQKLDQLTGWRFIAAFGVILCHFSDLLFPNQSAMFLSIWKGMANFVAFFFILSGFILAYNYQSKILEGSVSTRSFLVARFARIYPALIFSLIFSLPVFVFLNLRLHIPIAQLLIYSASTILLLKTWIPLTNWGNIAQWNGPTWSIETEFFFYLCFPFLVRPLSKLNLRSNIKSWIFLEFLMILIFAMYDILAKRAGGEPFQGAVELFHSSPYLCILEFVFGIITFNIAREIPQRTTKFLQDNAGWIFAILFVAYIGLNIGLPFMSRFHGLPSIVFSFAIILSYTNPGALRFLQTKSFLYLGEISYSLYLLHIPVLNLFLYASKGIPAVFSFKNAMSPVFALFAIGTSIGLAAFCMKFIEEPWRRKIRSAFR